MGGYRWLLVLLLLASCTSNVQELVDRDERVTVFLDVFPESVYSQAEFSASNMVAIADLTKTECPNATFETGAIRATYQSPAATLSAYVSDSEVICVVSKLNEAAFVILKGDPSTVAADVLFTVNDEPITQQDVQSLYAQFTPQVAQSVSQESILNTLIDQKLLSQALSTIEIDDERIEEELQSRATAAGFETIDELISSNNLNRTAVESMTRTQLQFNEFLATDDVQITQEDAKNFYLNNPDLFFVEEQVTFRQIFISLNQSRTKEAATQKLQQLLDEQAEFCDLVTKYSDDKDSIGRCGTYTITKGTILPELETALFALQDGQSSVIESTNGFHVVVRTNHTPAAVVAFGDAQNQVMTALEQSVREQQLQIYLIKLRAQAKIVNYT